MSHKIKDSIRFEVFKRDRFTCQYCGRKAPDVVLNCDHINPVAAGGTDDLLNLVTSCRDCNSGKSDRVLDDASAVERARAQAEALEERREQIRMMAQWHVELAKLDPEMDAIAEVLRAYGLELDQTGKREVKAIVRKYGLQITMASIAAGCDQSSNPTWGYIAAIAKNKQAEHGDPVVGKIIHAFNAIVRPLGRHTRRYHECRDIVLAWHRDGYAALDLLRSCQQDAVWWNRFEKSIRSLDAEVRK